MKQSSNSRRSRGRNNGGKRQGNRNGNFDSNGPDGRIRGNASQVHEKYLSLARDALASDDWISSENYSQHAEHFYRIIAHNAEIQANNDKTNPTESSSNSLEQANVNEKTSSLDQNEKNNTPRRNNRNNNRSRVIKSEEVEKNNITDNNQPRVSKKVETTSVTQNDINHEHEVKETESLSGTSDAVTTDNPNDTDDAAKNILA